MTYISKSENETEALGRAMASKLLPGAVIALHGELGSGKTAFVRGLAVGLGVEANVSSPTYTIANEYMGKTPLFHFDAYRLGSGEELLDIGWDDYLDRRGVCAVEWGENVRGVLGNDVINISFIKLGGDVRSIEIEGVGTLENIGD